MADFWFARRFPVGHPRKAMAPVSREGWMVVAGFVVAMVVGAILFIVTALSGSPVTSVVVFVVIAAVSGGAFIVTAMSKGDSRRMIEDYRSPAPGQPV